MTATRGSNHDGRLDTFATTDADGVESSEASDAPRLAFVFSGMGPQWWGMGRRLAEQEPVFRDTLERCDRALRPHAEWSLLEELGRDEATSRVGRADLAEVTNFAIQAALAALWRHWGAAPDAVVGHSAGEIAAAHVSGALDLEQSLLLAYHRSRLQARAAGKGRMLAAAIPPSEAEELLGRLGGTVELAAVNAPASVTLTGDAEPLEELERRLGERRVFARLLPVDVPYHSRHMDAIRGELLEALAPLTPRATPVAFVSVVTADWAPGTDLGPEYWWRSVRRPVLFGAAVGRLLDAGYGAFLELGAQPVLASSLRECIAARKSRARVLSSIRRHEDEREAMLRSLATLHRWGRPVDTDVLRPGAAAPDRIRKWRAPGIQPSR